MDDKRTREIMESVGMPNSQSLMLALEQVANEVAQEVHSQYTQKTEDVDNYRDSSPVARNRKIIKEITNSHWNYMEKVILSTTGPGHNKVELTMEEYLAMRKWDYTSAMTHGFGHGVEETLSKEHEVTMTSLVARQKSWSTKTFGACDPMKTLDHIQKEVEEIREDPSDTEEWIDIIILAMEGAWGTGATPKEVVNILEMKMTKNERRSWPALEDQVAGQAVEHLATPVPGGWPFTGESLPCTLTPVVNEDRSKVVCDNVMTCRHR